MILNLQNRNMKLHLCILLFTSLILFQVNAQKRIDGVFKKENCVFETEDRTYWIGYFHEGIAQISKDGYLGLIDSSGLIICEPKYDKIFDFKCNATIVMLNGKYGVINKKGKEIHPTDIYFLSDFSEGIAIFRGPGMGLINEDGKVIAEGQYRSLSNYKEGMARFQNDLQYGIIDKQGKEKIVLSRDDFSDNLINASGYTPQIERLDKENMHLLIFSNGLAPTTKKIKGNQQYGYINTDGKEIIPVQYDEVTDFINNVAFVRKGEEWGVIDNSGKVVIAPQYQSIKLANDDLFIAVKNFKCGVVDKTDKPIIPFKFDEIEYLFKNLFAVFDAATKYKGNVVLGNKENRTKGGWGIINTEGRLVVPIIYDGIKKINQNIGFTSLVDSKKPLTTSLPRYIQEETLQIFNSNGFINNQKYRNEKVATDYSFDGNNQSDFLYLQLQGANSLCGQQEKFPLGYINSSGDLCYVYLNEFGEQAIKETYDIAFPFVNKMGIVGKKIHASGDTINYLTTDWEKENYIYGAIDNFGNVVIPIIYESLNFYDNYKIKDFIPVKLNGKWGVIDFKNKEIAPFKYDHIETVNTGAIVKIGTKFGFIDVKGNELIPIIYDELRELESGIFEVKTEAQKYLMNKRGDKIEL